MNEGNQAGPFWASLHRRLCDRVRDPVMRYHLQHHAHLEPSTRSGWPTLRLVVDQSPGGWVTPATLQKHYTMAAEGNGKCSSPLLDLAAIEVVDSGAGAL
jgi:hypothetical protein